MLFNKKRVTAVAMTALLSVSVLSGCADNQAPKDTAVTPAGSTEPAPAPAAEQGPVSPAQPSETAGASDEKLKGSISVDGSSTVAPITQAVAEEFKKEQPDVNVTVGISGTGGGMEKFIAGEIEICDASRPIKDEEKAKLQEKKIDYMELKVAFDGLSVVVNKDNDWVDHLTVDELKKMWEPNSTVKTWKDVRPSFPAEPIKFFTPGADSGTFEYFSEAITKTKKAIRTDVQASEDDNVLVKGVEGEKGGIAYFGYAYYEENKDNLKVVPVDAGNGPVVPSVETVKDGTYKPLSRPLFMYVRKDAVEKPEVKAFLNYYLTQGKELVGDVGYVPLNDEEYTKGLDLIK